MFLKAFEIDLSNNFFLYFLISFVLCASPLNKWGIFDPSNQLWTLLIITLNSYLLTKKKEHINYKISLLILNILYTPGNLGISGSCFFITSFPISELRITSFFRNLNSY